MKKIPSVFKRNYETDRLCRDEVVEGCEWVIAGEGVATCKWDGTACMIRDGKLFKRYDRKWDKKCGQFKPAPDGWEACEDQPNEHTGHWPGWLPVGDGPEDRWFWDAAGCSVETADGTYEACGPKFQGNPHNLEYNRIIPHRKHPTLPFERTFERIQEVLSDLPYEGIVFHHPDGRMAKVKRKDFGLPWPVKL